MALVQRTRQLHKRQANEGDTDNLVYELHRLTEEEIAVVEGVI